MIYGKPKCNKYHKCRMNECKTTIYSMCHNCKQHVCQKHSHQVNICYDCLGFNKKQIEQLENIQNCPVAERPKKFSNLTNN